MNDIEKEKTGGLIARRRREAGLTQKELAEKLYVSDKAVSKWETGVSMPDTALLIPISEILGLSVTELLMGEELENRATLELDRAEAMVKDVIDRAGSGGIEKSAQLKKLLRVIFLVSLIAGGGLCILCYLQGKLNQNSATLFVLAAVFGLYFCFFAKERLPDYYDQNRIGTYNHGPVRMNIPGVSFTNGNFPHIVRYIVLWSSATLLLCPTFMLLFSNVAAGPTGKWIVLGLLILGLVLPLYIIGKKYE